jgi:hypothetical protein
MSGDVFKNYSIIEVYLENSSQKVLLCKKKETNELYLINAITNKHIIEGLDLGNLKRNFDLIEDISETEDTLYIVTRYFNYPNIKEYLSKNRIVLSKQIEYLTLIFDKLLQSKAYPEHIIVSLINSNNIYIDEHGKIGFLALIAVNQEEININKSDIFNELANIIHTIFTGSEINNNTISADVPPDIDKIIQNCLNNEYLRYEDLVSDFKNSKLYRFINPEAEESMKMHMIRKKLTRRKRYNKFKKKGIIAIVILIALLPIIVPYALSKFKDSNNISTVDNGYDTVNSSDESKTNDEKDEKENVSDNKVDNTYNNTEDIEQTEEETIGYFLNNEILNIIEAENIGEIDKEKFHEGDSSVKIINTEDENIEFLVGVIDLNSDMFSFLKERKVDVSMWVTSSIKSDGVITLKVLKDNKLLSQISKKVEIPDDIWELNNIEIETGNGERIEIYVSIPGKSAAWIDSFSVDILK